MCMEIIPGLWKVLNKFTFSFLFAVTVSASMGAANKFRVKNTS